MLHSLNRKENRLGIGSGELKKKLEISEKKWHGTRQKKTQGGEKENLCIKDQNWRIGGS